MMLLVRIKFKPLVVVTPQAISFRQAKHRGGSFFFKSNDSVIGSLTALGKCPEPTKEVFEGCEELICRVLRVKKETFITAKELHWHVFCGRDL